MSQLYLSFALSALLAAVIGSAFYVGVWWESQSQTIRDLEDYQEGAEDAKNATTDLPDDDSSRINWLREYLGR